MDSISQVLQNKKYDRIKTVFNNQRQKKSNQLSKSSNTDFSKYLKKEDQIKSSKWFNKLNEKPLLQLMAEQLQHYDFKPINTGQLNCFERLKKLLSAQNGSKNSDKQIQATEKILDNVVLMESHINELEDKYRQLENQNIRKNNNSAKSLKTSCLTSKNTSFMVSASSLNATLKDSSANIKNIGRQSRPQSSDKAAIIKRSIKQQMRVLKQNCCDKFLKHKKELNQRIFLQVDEHIGTKLQGRMEEIVNCRVGEYYALREENTKFNQIIFEKDLQIQTLKKELKIKEEKLEAKAQKEEPFQQLSSLKISMQQFCQEYHSLFGTTTLLELKKKMDVMEAMYIDNYSKEESKHLELYGRIQHEKDELQAKLKQKMKSCELREQELNEIMLRKQKMDKLDNSDQKHQIFNRIPEYKLKCSQLEHLQKFILDRYIEWLDNKREIETTIINLTSNRQQIQDYEEMIETILQFNKNYGNPDKNIEFIAKLLGGIQKIKRLIVGGRNNEKLEPFHTLDEIQAYIKKSKLHHPTKMRTHFKGFRQTTEHYLSDSTNP